MSTDIKETFEVSEWQSLVSGVDYYHCEAVRVDCPNGDTVLVFPDAKVITTRTVEISSTSED